MPRRNNPDRRYRVPRYKVKRSNPVNWERQASWHEGEGSRLLVRSKKRRNKTYTITEPKTVVTSQDIARREIPDTLCEELTKAGFKSAKVSITGRNVRCEVSRLQEQAYFLTKIKPYIISKDTTSEIDSVLEYITRPKKVGKKPLPFKP